MKMLTFHLVSGDAFLAGLTLLAIAWILRQVSRTRARVRLIRMVAFLGMIEIGLSATPLNPWAYAAGAIVVCLWMFLFFDSERVQICRAARTVNFLVAALLILISASELSYRWFRAPSEKSKTKLTVIGDSISAGMLGPDEPTWPKQFRQAYGIDVVDLSQPGATASSALRQAEGIPTEPSLILIEIGGNDLLGGRSAEQFAADLEKLLEFLTERNHNQLVMMELPLPPFYNKFGRAQRRLAKRYNVALIPKRAFARIILSEGETLDGLHLSASGHRMMAKTIWDYLHPLLKGN